MERRRQMPHDDIREPASSIRAFAWRNWFAHGA
jgi:hypothetical protein